MCVSVYVYARVCPLYTGQVCMHMITCDGEVHLCAFVDGCMNVAMR